MVKAGGGGRQELRSLSLVLIDVALPKETNYLIISKTIFSAEFYIEKPRVYNVP